MRSCACGCAWLAGGGRPRPWWWPRMDDVLRRGRQTQTQTPPWAFSPRLGRVGQRFGRSLPAVPVIAYHHQNPQYRSIVLRTHYQHHLSDWFTRKHGLVPKHHLPPIHPPSPLFRLFRPFVTGQSFIGPTGDTGPSTLCIRSVSFQFLPAYIPPSSSSVL